VEADIAPGAASVRTGHSPGSENAFVASPRASVCGDFV
jgi:hypothetical protein